MTGQLKEKQIGVRKEGGRKPVHFPSKELAVLREERNLDQTLPSISLRHRPGWVPFEQTIWIAQQELGIIKGHNAYRYVGSPYFRNCSMVAVWNSSNHDCAVFHVSNKTCVYDVVKRVKSLTKNGKWNITMAGGAEQGVPQSYLMGRKYNWVLALLLYRFSHSNSGRLDFHYMRPSGLPPTTENDKTYLLDKETGELFSVDNHLVLQEEQRRPGSLGPHFTERFNAANLFPYFAATGFPCVLAFNEGKYTDSRPAPSEKLTNALSRLQQAYRHLQEGRANRTALLGLDFVKLLAEHLPWSRYLIDRCQRESMMRTYMQEQLLIFWGMKDSYPVPA